MSMAVGDSKGGPMAEINVTPMADIMIVLLIIFMVITPMLQKGVDVKLPQASNTKDKKDDPKTITVAVKKDPFGKTYLNGIPLERQPKRVHASPAQQGGLGRGAGHRGRHGEVP